MLVTDISNSRSNEPTDSSSHELDSIDTLRLPRPTVEFLRALIPAGWIDIRAFKKNDPKPKQRFFWDNYVGCGKYADRQREQGYDVYFGVCSRRSENSGTADNCIHAWTVWADIDFKNDGEANSRARLDQYKFRPSIIVNSGGGIHGYWLLNEPISVQKHRARFEAALKNIAADLNADPAVCDIAHILRVPGTLNHKYNPPRPVFIESWNLESKYEFEQFVPADFSERAPQPRLQVHVDGDRTSLVERGRTYLASCPKPVIGEGSDNYTYRVCCRLIGTGSSHDIGLTTQEALPLLMEWQPEFDEWWFKSKLKSARRSIRNEIEQTQDQCGLNIETNGSTSVGKQNLTSESPE
jgi:hypothetical protein